MQKNSSRKMETVSISRLKKMYNVQTPEQIKMRIMWMTLQRICLICYGDTRNNRKILDHYDRQWKLAELAEIQQHSKSFHPPVS